ncbi:hypothetical protein CPB84DRAFT_1768376, partial [Gymnopilus junonius]
MFRDPELDILGMIMSDGGRSLRDREAKKGKEGRKVSEEERRQNTHFSFCICNNYFCRKAFVDALASLHKAGVRHDDIRPENLLISSEGQVFIIDLDRADFSCRQTPARGRVVPA